MPGNEDVENEEFVGKLGKIEEEGGVIEWENDNDGTMKSLFITSKTMTDAATAVLCPQY